MALLGKLFRSAVYRFAHSTFNLWERFGVHIVPDDYYFPIPNLSQLQRTKSRWQKPTDMVGLDMNLNEQLRMMRTVFPQYAAECDFPLYAKDSSHEYYAHNTSYSPSDASIAHSIIRHFQPCRVVEIGSGNSTLLLARAKSFCSPRFDLIVIDPYPTPFLLGDVPGINRLIQCKVEDLDIEFFCQLQQGDVLFIDSSHIVRLGGDVLFLYLEVLPRLAPGVLVHVHDICLPLPYPEEWIFNRHWFFDEQYLLQAFLSFNTTFKILWATTYMNMSYLSELQTNFPHYWSGSSLWIRKEA